MIDQISSGVEPIKEAMRGLTAIAKASKPSFGVRVTGDGPGIAIAQPDRPLLMARATPPLGA